MTEADFETHLADLYGRPTGSTDPVVLARAIVAAVEREERRRALLLSGGAGVGLAIGGAVVAGLGVLGPVTDAWRALSAGAAAEAPFSWIFAALLSGSAVAAMGLARGERGRA